MPQQAMQTAAQTENSSITINLNSLPKHENDRMCRVLLNSIRTFYENPANMKEFEAQQSKRNAKEAKHG